MMTVTPTAASVSTATTRVACYARVSTSFQVDRNGVASQLHSIDQYVERRGWQVQTRYTDEGLSGRSQERPALKRLMRDVRDRRVQVVIVTSVDRLARSLKHFIDLLAEFEDNGCALVSLTEQIDTSTATGRAFIAVRAIFAELEASLASERIRAGMDAARSRGTRIGKLAKLTFDQAQTAVNEHGGLRAAARHLGVSPSTVQRALARTVAVPE